LTPGKTNEDLAHGRSHRSHPNRNKVALNTSLWTGNQHVAFIPHTKPKFNGAALQGRQN